MGCSVCSKETTLEAFEMPHYDESFVIRLQGFLNEKPEGHARIKPGKVALETWEKLGSLDFEMLIKDKLLKIEHDPAKKKMPLAINLNKDSYGVYLGQMDEDRKLHGIGRWVDQHGKIHEGQFMRGIPTGFIRRIHNAIVGEYYIGFTLVT